MGRGCPERWEGGGGSARTGPEPRRKAWTLLGVRTLEAQGREQVVPLPVVGGSDDRKWNGRACQGSFCLL